MVVKIMDEFIKFAMNCRFSTSSYKHGCVIRGPTVLHGTDLVIPDLRAGFSTLIAAIVAKGTSTIAGVEHRDRGYEDIQECLRGLGVDITRRSDTG